DGATHQALEDIAIMRTMPNMTVISPCDYNEAKKATKAMLKIIKGPCYLRLGRAKANIITRMTDKFEIGKINVLKRGKDATIIATGYMVEKALNAAKTLEKEGIKVSVIDCHTIKPLDREIIQFAKRTKAIVTAEEHQIAGGLGSAVAEMLSQEYPVPIEFIGVKDRFGQSGKAEELYKLYGLDEKSITKAVKKAIKRKGSKQ
ncbi:transketolase family protein, partial [Candidatus Woesearchaeota archaeon]